MSWVAVGLLLAGCASGAVQHRGTSVVPGAGGLTPQASARASVPAAGPAQVAVTPGGPCPTQSQWLGRPAPTTIDGTPANTPEAEALSQAVGAAGREGAFADVYGTLISDFPPGHVALCVTDLAGGRRMAAEAKRLDPHVELARLDLYLARYSAKRLDAAAQRLVRLMPKGTLGFPVNGVAAGSDAASVEVDTNAAGVASAAFKHRLEQLTGGIPVTLVDQGPAVAL